MATTAGISLLLAGAGAVTLFAEQPAEGGDLESGIAAYQDYRFETAGRHFATAAKQIKKLSEKDAELLEESRRQLRNAEEYLERVEKLTIIDSIAVDADSFFKAYRLPASAGSILPPDSIPFRDRREDATTMFANENRDFRMWAEADTTGYTRLAESTLLTDGTWSEPVFAPTELGDGGDCDFPFMMADGTTLYYASDGEGSIGGLDIFVATRDASTGEYLQPRNIGMPYNSPFDDYMLAIDELNGVGWWATDRNRLDGKVTVYVFLVNDLRQNYDSDELDEQELINYARISNYRDTWATDGEPDERITEALNAIKDIVPGATKRKADFHFPVPGGGILTTIDDFKGTTAKEMMKKYLATEKEYRDLVKHLDDKRREYHKAKSKTLAEEISRIEKVETELAEKVRKSRSEVYRALGE